MKTIRLVLLTAVLVGALVYLNSAMQNASGGGQSPPPSTQTASSASSNPQQDTTAIPDYQVFGNPAKARRVALIGWEYDSANQGDQTALRAALAAIPAAVDNSPSAAAIVADIDVPAADRAPIARRVTHLGVVINGKPVSELSANLGEGDDTAIYLSHLLAYKLAAPQPE